MNYILITKKPGIKNCIRINSTKDIPNFLKEVIIVDDNQLILDCLEGKEKVPFGSVIAFEKLENGKMNVWHKENWKTTTIEIDGHFYELPKTYKAIYLEEDLPVEIINELGKKLSKKEDGSFQIDVGWGLVSCAPHNGYLVIYDRKEDGSLDVNFLTKNTPSYEEYFVVDEKTKQIIEPLKSYDEKINQYNNTNMIRKKY